MKILSSQRSCSSNINQTIGMSNCLFSTDLDILVRISSAVWFSSCNSPAVVLSTGVRIISLKLQTSSSSSLSISLTSISICLFIAFTSSSKLFLTVYFIDSTSSSLSSFCDPTKSFTNKFNSLESFVKHDLCALCSLCPSNGSPLFVSNSFLSSTSAWVPKKHTPDSSQQTFSINFGYWIFLLADNLINDDKHFKRCKLV